MIPGTFTPPLLFLQPRYLPQIVTNIYFICLGKGETTHLPEEEGLKSTPCSQPSIPLFIIFQLLFNGIFSPPPPPPCWALLPSSARCLGSCWRLRTPNPAALGSPRCCLPLMVPTSPLPPTPPMRFFALGFAHFLEGELKGKRPLGLGTPWWGTGGLGLGWGGAAACLQP